MYSNRFLADFLERIILVLTYNVPVHIVARKRKKLLSVILPTTDRFTVLSWI